MVDVGRNITMKCRKCRHILLKYPENVLLTAHHTDIEDTTQEDSKLCKSLEENYVWYLQEEKLPQWILNSISEAGWQKSKLLCPNCSVRLGSFNFVSGAKCSCDKFVIPPVHIIRGKVDYTK